MGVYGRYVRELPRTHVLAGFGQEGDAGEPLRIEVSADSLRVLPDGGVVAVGAAGEWYTQLKDELGVAEATKAADVVKAASGLSTWKWVALIGIPVGLVGGVLVGRKLAK